MLRALCEEEADLSFRHHRNSVDSDGDTALHIAINFGADLNAQNKAGYTPLHCAVLRGSVSCVEFLVDNGYYTGSTNSYWSKRLAGESIFFIEDGLQIFGWRICGDGDNIP